MKTFLSICLLAVSSLTCIAADTALVKLMHDVITQQVDTSYSYFYLLDQAKNPRIDGLGDIVREEPKIASSIPLSDFVTTIKADSSTFNWSSYNLPRAKCVDPAHLPKHVGWTRVIRIMPVNTKQATIDSLDNKGIIVVLVKPNARKKEINKQEKKVLARLDNRPWKDKTILYFQNPYFRQINNML